MIDSSPITATHTSEAHARSTILRRHLPLLRKPTADCQLSDSCVAGDLPAVDRRNPALIL